MADSDKPDDDPTNTTPVAVLLENGVQIGRITNWSAQPDKKYDEVYTLGAKDTITMPLRGAAHDHVILDDQSFIEPTYKPVGDIRVTRSGVGMNNVVVSYLPSLSNSERFVSTLRAIHFTKTHEVTLQFARNQPPKWVTGKGAEVLRSVMEDLVRSGHLVKAPKKTRTYKLSASGHALLTDAAKSS